MADRVKAAVTGLVLILFLVAAVVAVIAEGVALIVTRFLGAVGG